MKRFVALYFLFLALLFTFFYADTSALSQVINETQTDWTLRALDLFLAPGQLQGIDIQISPHYKIIINQACNGMIPLLFLYASILAYPASIRYKMVWMGIGYVVYFISNVARILLVVYFVSHEGGRANFHWAHDMLGNTILVVVGVALFLFFVRSARRRSV